MKQFNAGGYHDELSYFLWWTEYVSHATELVNWLRFDYFTN